MTEDLPEDNWKITRIGSLSLVAIGVAFTASILYLSSGRSPLIYAIAAGVVFSIGAKLGEIDRFKTITRPFSGFLNMAAGALLLTSVLKFLPVALEIGIKSLRGFSGSSIMSLVGAVFLPLIGFSVMLLGVFISSTGSALVFWDRAGERVPLGVKKRDMIFSVILGAITALGIFGTAFLRDIPVFEYLQSFLDFLTGSQDFATIITAVLLLVVYKTVRTAWKSLPIKESIPRSKRDAYDHLKKPEKAVRFLVVPLFALATAASGFGITPYLGILKPLSSPGFRSVLLGTLIISISIYIGVKLLKILTGDFDKVKKLFPYIFFAAVVYFMAPFLTGFLDSLLSQLPGPLADVVGSLIEDIGREQAVMILMTVGSVSAFFLKGSMDLMRLFGLVPKGVEGTTLLASGIFFSAIGFHLNSSNLLILFAGVAAAMTIWELGKRSVILGGEIGRSGSTYQAELVQLVSKLIIAGFSVFLASYLVSLVSGFGIPSPQGPSGLVVLVVALIGIGLLTASMKEFT